MISLMALRSDLMYSSMAMALPTVLSIREAVVSHHIFSTFFIAVVEYSVYKAYLDVLGPAYPFDDQW